MVRSKPLRLGCNAVTLLVLYGVAGCSRKSLPAARSLIGRPPDAAVSGSVIAAREVVFDTRNSCEEIDIPDAPARAFRDDSGKVHLIATHYVARAMVGSTLNIMRHDCGVLYRSPKDRNPAGFRYNNWIYAFYAVVGNRVAALVHSEFDADEIPGMCATPDDTNNCWWNTVTFASSIDGGYTFTAPQPPRNLIAALPYRYEVGNHAGAYGYHMPTNIMHVADRYYALINVWPYKNQQYGACLISTSNVFDPTSWRGWDGENYSIRFVDPYREATRAPNEHICPPVLSGEVHSLVQNAETGAFIVTQFAPDDRFNGPPGFYLQSSSDLKHWSSPTLLVSFNALRTDDPPGNWTYNYESLLDPSSTDRNFSTVSANPYLYYVRLDGDHPPYARVLFRRKVRLRFDEETRR